MIEMILLVIFLKPITFGFQICVLYAQMPMRCNVPSYVNFRHNNKSHPTFFVVLLLTMTENDGIKKQFLGPSCLYKLLATRFEENPFMLRRNLSVRDKKKKRTTKEVSIQVEFNDITNSSLISLCLIGKKFGSPDLFPYQILKLQHSQRILCETDSPHIETFSFDRTTFHDEYRSLSVLIIQSNNSSEQEDKRTISAICKTLGNFQWKKDGEDQDPEQVSIVMRRPTITFSLIDVVALQCVKIMRYKKPNQPVQFRSFMLPAGPCMTSAKLLPYLQYYLSSSPPDITNATLSADILNTVNRINYSVSSIAKPSNHSPSSSSSATATTNNNNNNNHTMINTAPVSSYSTSLLSTESNNATTGAVAANRPRKCKQGSDDPYRYAGLPPLHTLTADQLPALAITHSHLLEEKHIHYHFVANDPNDQKSSYLEFYSEKVCVPKCIWCGYTISSYALYSTTDTCKFVKCSAQSLAMLSHHFQTFHDHFQYDLKLDRLGHVHITTQRKRNNVKSTANVFNNSPLLSGVLALPRAKTIPYQRFESLEVWSDQNHNNNNNNKPSNGQNGSSTRLSNGKSNKNGQKGSKQMISLSSSSSSSSLIKQPQEIFFHPQTGQQMTLDTLISLSHAVDDAFEIKSQNMIIDEYTDITAQEKELMKLWNSHIATFPTYGDRFISITCERFVQRYAHVLWEKQLRHNWLLHLLIMWDFGLLYAEEVHQYVTMLDDYTLNRCQLISSSSSSSSQQQQQQKKSNGCKH